MSEKSEFSVGEQVIIEDTGLFYVAKIIEIKDNEYKIHYNGWSSRFDKWVKKEELNKDTELNRALMKFNNGRGKKEERLGKSLQIDLFAEMSTYSDSLSKCQFPILLREQLVEEWFMVTDENLFLPLPCKVTMRMILQTFLEEVKAESKTAFENASELVQGLVYYMNTDARKAVFYTAENDIIETVSKKSIPILDIFGAEHLLRLLFIVPMLYSTSELSQNETQYVHDVLSLLFDFLLRHSEYFCPFDEYVSSEQVIESLQ
ncbi:histone acetylase complex subunit [Blastocystis sp. ATCC 50177/Nand II]|uniref:Histone acetylase complex subunit n=1 Tax=Blastocystis sp. subtype 1 (strain ATCC 50177 / NandII) TaxID=478820 RepID=A0A196SKQ4_BLAHN|nr:histone acetylase complex subunit [Blastocystis sp. ATCC 50177/Nand II]